MTAPFGREYASLYDALNPNKDYGAESDFVIEQTIGVSADCSLLSLLDVGCGTGRHLERFAHHFGEVAGVDRSEDMAALARIRVPRAQVETGDAAQARLGRRFDVVTALFDVLSYQTTNDEAIAFLETIREHLLPSGIALIDFWYLPGVVTAPPETRVRRGCVDGADFLRVSVPEIDWNAATTHVSMTTLMWTGQLLQLTVEETHSMRAFMIDEVELLARAAGLRLHGSGGWMQRARATTADWHAYVTLRHAG